MKLWKWLLLGSLLGIGLAGIGWGQTTMSGPVTTARIASCDEQVALGGRIYTLRQLGYCSRMEVLPPPEPEDVPAVTAKRKTCAKYYSITTGGSPSCEVFKDEVYPTCADKKRILQHDEDDPPTYWCHKVHSGEPQAGREARP